MDLNLSPEDRAFRDQTRTWLAANVPRTELKTLEERRAWHRRMFDAGYVGIGWPKEYGGQGASPMKMAIVADEMARANAPAPINGLGVGFIGPKTGDLEQLLGIGGVHANFVGHRWPPRGDAGAAVFSQRPERSAVKRRRPESKSSSLRPRPTVSAEKATPF